jgi:hypothetical protein
MSGCIRTKLRTPLVAPISGMRGWYDASSRSNFTFSSGDIVSQWNDLSGNAYHAKPQVDAYDHKPTLDANVLNGKSALHFLGGSNIVDSNNKNLLFTNDSSIRTIFWVFKGSSFLLTNSGTLYDFHRNTDNTATDPPWVAQYAAANVQNGATRVNRVAVKGTTFNMPTNLNNGFNLISIETAGTVTADGFNRDRVYHSGEQWHAECIIYDTPLELNKVIQMEEYLGIKWGLF